VVGVDLDGEKIEQGRRLGSGLPNLDFVSRRLEEFLPELSDGSVQGALLADVLSSIPFELQDQLIHGVARVLAPGGRVVLLFVDTQPRLRAAVTAVRSFFVCRFLRLSRSATWRFFYRSRAALRRCLESEGLEIIKDHGLPGFAPRRKFVAEKRRS
jgi:SAM-dependent methyltransferase